MFKTRMASRWWLVAVVVLCSASAVQALNQARLYGTITEENTCRGEAPMERSSA